jgi:hypothetical protein
VRRGATTPPHLARREPSPFSLPFWHNLPSRKIPIVGAKLVFAPPAPPRAITRIAPTRGTHAIENCYREKGGIDWDVIVEIIHMSYKRMTDSQETLYRRQ